MLHLDDPSRVLDVAWPAWEQERSCMNHKRSNMAVSHHCNAGNTLCGVESLTEIDGEANEHDQV